MRLPLFLLFLAVSTGGCTSGQKDEVKNDENILVDNNFESLMGWVPTNPTLTKEQAHSGSYSIKVGGTHEYSLTFDAELGRVIARKPRKIRLDSWVYATAPSSAAYLNLQVVNPVTNQLVFNDGIVINDVVSQLNTWTPISKEIMLPDSVQPSHNIRLFLWRSYTLEDVYADDIKVTVME